jgi:hypothetical protein
LLGTTVAAEIRVFDDSLPALSCKAKSRFAALWRPNGLSDDMPVADHEADALVKARGKRCPGFYSTAFSTINLVVYIARTSGDPGRRILEVVRVGGFGRDRYELAPLFAPDFDGLCTERPRTIGPV